MSASEMSSYLLDILGQSALGIFSFRCCTVCGVDNLLSHRKERLRIVGDMQQAVHLVAHRAESDTHHESGRVERQQHLW